MKREFEKITIAKLRKPSEQNINSDLQWLSSSLGLFGERDKEKSCFRVFIEVVKSTRRKRPLSSDEIAFKSNLSRATVIHHLNKLIESGLVTPSDSFYMLRTNNMCDLVEEVRRDIFRILEDLSIKAEEIDSQLGLKNKKESRIISD